MFPQCWPTFYYTNYFNAKYKFFFIFHLLPYETYASKFNNKEKTYLPTHTWLGRIRFGGKNNIHVLILALLYIVIHHVSFVFDTITIITDIKQCPLNFRYTKIHLRWQAFWELWDQLSLINSYKSPSLNLFNNQLMM